MQYMIQFFIALSFVSYAFSQSLGDVRITGGGDSGRLEFRISNGQWSTVCRNGFDDDAADVACRQLDYVRADDVYTFANASSSSPPPFLCGVSCDGDEDELVECTLNPSRFICGCNDIVGISCTDTLTAGQIVGVVIGTLVFIGLVTTIIILCICCLVPTCPCYYRGYRTARTAVVVTTQVPQTQMVAATDTKANYYPPPAYDNTY